MALTRGITFLTKEEIDGYFEAAGSVETSYNVQIKLTRTYERDDYNTDCLLIVERLDEDNRVYKTASRIIEVDVLRTCYLEPKYFFLSVMGSLIEMLYK